MIQVRVDTRVMDAKLAKLRSNRLDARREGTAVAANEVIRFVVTRAPKDTNRYVRGWQKAQNDIARGSSTVAPIPLDVIKPSRYAAQIRTRIAKQASYWTGVRVRLEQQLSAVDKAGFKRESPRGVRALKRLEKVRVIEERAREMLRWMNENPDGATHAILIGGKRRLNPYTLGRLARIDAKFHGGYARFAHTATATFVEVKNLEPHANIVEARTRLMRSALGASRSIGLQQVRGVYIKQLTQHVGVLLPKGGR